jgi:tetratricopeptide (TPR) repeat protein
VLICGALNAARTNAAPTTSPSNPADLISSLSSADPVQRKETARRLIEMGAEARPLLVDAEKSDDPQIRAAAGQILLKLPWFTASDSPAVRDCLQSYSLADPDARRLSISRLSSLPVDQCSAPLLRLLREEPSEDIRWYIAAMLREPRFGWVREKLRAMEIDPANAPLMYSMATAWAPRDPQKAQELYRRAIDAVTTAGAGNAELSMALEMLTASAMESGHYNDAARLLRRAMAQEAGNESSDVALQLLALHARHGPLDGYEADLRVISRQASAGPMLYAGGELMRRGDHFLLAAMADVAALISGGGAVESHWDSADFLMRQGWTELAGLEFRAVLWCDGNDPNSKRLMDINAHFRLSRLAGMNGDDLAAAREMETAVKLTSGNDNVMRGNGSAATAPDLLAEVHWRYYRAAKQSGDDKEAKKRLDELAKLSPTDASIILRVTSDLKEAGRGDLAKQWFDAAYADARTKLDADRNNVELMNNLAWLCARCGEKIDEAVALSQRAMVIEPENAAYLDTAAEAQFRAGHADEAVRLETRALTLRPGDVFMRAQLERFQGKRTDIMLEE